MEQNMKEKQFTSLIEEYKRVIYKICYMYATDGDNGLWLCENHHKLFDRNIIAIMSDGTVKYHHSLSAAHIPYLHMFTENTQLPSIYLNDNFMHYVELRNRVLDTASYVGL